MKHLIIGNGPAAIAAAETLRAASPDCRIQLLSAEEHPFYSPCPLAEYVEGSVRREELFLRDADFYRRLALDIRYRTPATRIDTSAHRVWSGDQSFSYDRLLLACGSRALMPPVPGLEAGTPGIYALKTLADADAILARLARARRAVVIGSGFIGLEAVQALVRKGLAVTLLEARPQVLPTMLSPAMAERVEQRLTEHGVRVMTGSAAERVLTDEQGVRAVQSGSETLPCELLICAAGVRADTALAESAGIACQRGVLVDEQMQTSAADVFAAGDVIEMSNGPAAAAVLPTWPNAVSSGQVAARGMMGKSHRHCGLEAVNVVRIFGVPVASFGQPDPLAETICWENESGAVRSLLIRNERIAGGQFIGEINGSGLLHNMMKQQRVVSPGDLQLVDPEFCYEASLAYRR